MHLFDENEKKQIVARGSSVDSVEGQLLQFDSGVAFANLARPATIADGILSLSNDESSKLVAKYLDRQSEIDVLKFVPASGAATRMFKELFQAIEEEEGNAASEKLHSNLGDFAFQELLNTHLDEINADTTQSIDVCKGLLSESGLNYGQLPKGLLLFHKYTNHQRTPFYEQLIEGKEYAGGGNDKVALHFTVSENHLDAFKQHLETVVNSPTLSGVEFDIQFSTQKKITDTIAVDLDNKPFKKDDGEFLFRPGGHGALINNLNDLDADIIFIKNIDNVVHDDFKADTILYKKLIAGVLIEYQDKIFGYLNEFNQKEDIESLIPEVESFVKGELGIKLSEAYALLSVEDKKTYLTQKLNRPIRVCGMVKNTGEPGGGPFWVLGDDGSASLQIVESAQVDMGEANQGEMLKKSTHFNPVDLVCGVKDYQGAKFDLANFVDPNSGFITQKSVSGKDIKALEHPGLWNGAMANWTTVFVEVPISTFNPVKTVLDLLKKEHAPA